MGCFLAGFEILGIQTHPLQLVIVQYRYMQYRYMHVRTCSKPAGHRAVGQGR
jgi:hypothetical protein